MSFRVSKKHHKLSAAVDSIDNQALSDHRNIRGLEKKRIKKQEKLIFEPRLDVVMPEGYQVQLRGLKQLPNNFEQSLNDYKQEQFRFRLQPLRIISDKGLLVSWNQAWFIRIKSLVNQLVRFNVQLLLCK